MSYGQSGIDHNMTICEKCGEPKADHYRVRYGHDDDLTVKYLVCKTGFDLLQLALEYSFKEREYAR